MNIYTMGIDYTTGNPLAEPVDEQMFGAELLRSFDRNADATTSDRSECLGASLSRGGPAPACPRPAQPI
jgi:hypothetical protein